MKKKKVNPHKIPFSQADVKKSWEKGTEDCLVFMLDVLGRHGATDEDLGQFAEEVRYEVDSVCRKFATVEDFIQALKDEKEWSVELK